MKWICVGILVAIALVAVIGLLKMIQASHELYDEE